MIKITCFNLSFPYACCVQKREIKGIGMVNDRFKDKWHYITWLLVVGIGPQMWDRLIGTPADWSSAKNWLYKLPSLTAILGVKYLDCK